jgi:hypothetical protein
VVVSSRHRDDIAETRGHIQDATIISTPRRHRSIQVESGHRVHRTQGEQNRLKGQE